MTEKVVGVMRSLLGRQQELAERAEGIKQVVVTAAVLTDLSVVALVVFVTTVLFR